jgi:hypothetical protein
MGIDVVVIFVVIELLFEELIIRIFLMVLIELDFLFGTNLIIELGLFIITHRQEWFLFG